MNWDTCPTNGVVAPVFANRAAKSACPRISIRISESPSNELREADRRKSELGFSDEELAFYDSIAGFGEEHAFDVPYLAELTHEIVQAVKRNLKVDWTKPHRQDVKAEIRAQVKTVLRRRGVRADNSNLFSRA